MSSRTCVTGTGLLSTATTDPTWSASPAMPHERMSPSRCARSRNARIAAGSIPHGSRIVHKEDVDRCTETANALLQASPRGSRVEGVPVQQPAEAPRRGTGRTPSRPLLHPGRFLQTTANWSLQTSEYPGERRETNAHLRDDDDVIAMSTKCPSHLRLGQTEPVNRRDVKVSDTGLDRCFDQPLPVRLARFVEDSRGAEAKGGRNEVVIAQPRAANHLTSLTRVQRATFRRGRPSGQRCEVPAAATSVCDFGPCCVRYSSGEFR